MFFLMFFIFVHYFYNKVHYFRLSGFPPTFQLTQKNVDILLPLFIKEKFHVNFTELQAMRVSQNLVPHIC